MARQNEACDMCTRTCMLIHGQRDPSPVVSSFFKVMIDKSFSNVLYFPPRFARSISHLTDQETYMEDASGQRWRVGICKHKGSLAIREGWRAFSSEHDLKVGDFLVFHYIQGQHFVVQIFGTNGCQKINFYNGTHMKKKRLRTNCTTTSHDKLSPETDKNLRKERNSTPSVTVVPESERAGRQPVTTTFAPNIDADIGERQIVPYEEVISDVLQGENGPHDYTDLISQKESSSVDGAPCEMEFLTLTAPLLDVKSTQTENISGPVSDISLLGLADENGHHMGLISITSLNSAENGGKGKETRVDKRELKEIVAKTRCPPDTFKGKEPKTTEKDAQVYPEAVIGNNKAMTKEPADSGDTSFPDADSFSCSLRVDGRNFLGGEICGKTTYFVRRREMAHQNEACDMCTRTCMLIHGQRDPSPVVSSFFKVMIDKSFSKVLYFPPRFARSVSHLTDQETYMEDASGQRWRVGICNHKGSLAIQQGWHAFSSDHDLKVGEFLVFHYFQDQHFVVQIFGTNGCQKINFYNGTRMKKKRPRTNCTTTSHDELSPETDKNLRKKRNPTPPITVVPESERAGRQPVTTTFAPNIDADIGGRQIVPYEEVISDVLQGENGPHDHTDLISQKESSSVDGAPCEMEFLTLTALLLDVKSAQTENISGPVSDISLLGLADENGHHMGLISSTSLKSAENGGKGRETRVDKRQLKEIAAKTCWPPQKLNGKEPKTTEKDDPVYPEAVIGNNKAMTKEPADSGDTSFPDADSFSCSLRVDGRNFLELPQNFPQVLTRKKKGRITIYLKGPDNRAWPVLYHENSSFKFLAGTWELFTAVYGLKPGDECLFQLSDLSKRMFDVQVAHKVDVTQTSLS